MVLANKDIANELGLLYESIMQSEAVDTPPAIVQQEPAFSSHLTDFIKKVENPNKVGYKNGTWHAYRVSDREVDIGYGHRIIPGQDFSNGLDDTQVERLLQHDLMAALIKAKYYVNHTHGKQAWDNLDKRRQEMLIEFTFNLGSLNSFPKFVKAVVYNDIAGMKKEYKRHATMNGGTRELVSRNKAFFDAFLANYSGGYFTSS